MDSKKKVEELKSLEVVAKEVKKPTGRPAQAFKAMKGHITTLEEHGLIEGADLSEFKRIFGESLTKWLHSTFNV